MIKVGILGAGWAATEHADAFERMDDVTVTAVWNRTRERAEQLASDRKSKDVKVFNTWEKLIDEADVDIISICTAETLRRQPFEAALEQGRHVLVEKPFCTSLEDARSMAVAAKKAQKVAAICFSLRYAPGTQTALAAVRAGDFGQLRDIEMEWRAPTAQVFLERWPYSNDALGSFGMGGCHEFDRARFVTGCELVRVVGRILPAVSKGDRFEVKLGEYALLAEMSNGLLGTFRMTLNSGKRNWRFFVRGDEAVLEVTHEQAVRWSIDQEDSMLIDAPSEYSIREGMDTLQHCWEKLIRDFVRAVRINDINHKSVPYLPTIDDALRNQEIIAAALEAERERRWVSLEEFRTT